MNEREKQLIINKRTGFIKLYRSILDSYCYNHNLQTRILFIHFLLKANFDKGNSKGVLLERGQLVTGIFKLIKETGLSKQNIETALKRLEQYRNINKFSTKQYTIIEIVNYDKYQSFEIESINHYNKTAGFIKLYRSLLDNEIYKNNNEKLIFIHCLLKAEGNSEIVFNVERGQLKTTIEKLVEETNIKSEQIITALNSLKEKGMIEIKDLDYRKIQLITICNYNDYQDEEY